MVGAATVRPMIRRMTGALFGSLLLVVGVAACSDGGDGDDVVLEDVDETERTTTSSTSTTTDPTATSTTLAGGVFAEGCAQFNTAFGALAASIGVGSAEITAGALENFELLVQQAPADIRDPLLVYLHTFQEYADALVAAGVDTDNPSSVPPEDDPALAEATAIFSSDEFVDATEAISAFVASNCETG